jgi:hypothetical protein
MYFLTSYIEKLICENSNTNNNIADQSYNQQSHIIHRIAIKMTIITRSMSKPTKNNAKKETMYLRSVKKTATFSVDIDFDKGVRDPLWGSQPLSTEGALRAESLCNTNFIGDLWSPEKFDEASLAWNSNKQSIGNGCFVYTNIDEKPKRTRRAPQRYCE